MTKVRVPVPPQVVHVERLAPGRKPLPEQVLQSTIGDTFTLRVVPLQASKKLIPIVVSRSAPLVGPERREPLLKVPKSSSNKLDEPPPVLRKPPKALARSSNDV